MQTVKQINLWDNTPERKVWFQFWNSRITFEKSYLARLHYVHYNPALHGVVSLVENYKWCSVSWLARNAPPALVATVKSFKTAWPCPTIFDMECGDMSRRTKARTCPRTPRLLRRQFP